MIIRSRDTNKKQQTQPTKTKTSKRTMTNSSTCPCVLQGGAVEWEIYQDHFTTTSKMAYFGPSGAKIAFSASPFWHYIFSGFSEIRSIFKNTIFAKSRWATQTTKNEDGRGRRHESWPFFEDPDFELRVAMSRLETRKPHYSLQFWAFLHSAQKCQLHTQSSPEGGAKDERPIKCLILSMVPQEDAGHLAHLLR